MVHTASNLTEQPIPQTSADRIAQAAYKLIYHTPPEVVQEMDERIRELRRRSHQPVCSCILCWRAG